MKDSTTSGYDEMVYRGEIIQTWRIEKMKTCHKPPGWEHCGLTLPTAETLGTTIECLCPGECPMEDEIMKIPEIIYLQIKDDFGEELAEKTWCEDRINETDIKYKRVKEKDDATK